MQFAESVETTEGCTTFLLCTTFRSGTNNRNMPNSFIAVRADNIFLVLQTLQLLLYRRLVDSDNLSQRTHSNRRKTSKIQRHIKSPQRLHQRHIRRLPRQPHPRQTDHTDNRPQWIGPRNEGTLFAEHFKLSQKLMNSAFLFTDRSGNPSPLQMQKDKANNIAESYGIWIFYNKPKTYVQLLHMMPKSFYLI